MSLKKGLILALLMSAGFSGVALSQDAESAVERVRDAYNVEDLNNAKTIRIESDIRLPFESHDYTAVFHDMAKQRFHTVLDLVNQRGSREFVTTISRTSYHGRYLHNNGQTKFIAYGPDTYADIGDADFFTQFGGSFRSSDVLLSLWLTRQETERRYLGDTMWLGYWHDIVEVDFPNSPPLKVLIRREDGAITKMQRVAPNNQILTYTFLEHEKENGGLIAREHNFFMGDIQVYFSFNHNIVLNNRHDKKVFEIDKGIMLEAERTDQSQMQIRQIGTNEDPLTRLYQTCEGENCTAFMVANNGVIGFGMGDGFAARLEAFRRETAIDLPLTHVIAADHHEEDIGGASEARKAGATLLVTDQAAMVLNASTEDYSVEVVAEEKTIGDLLILPLSTDHTVKTLAAYHKKQKVVMQTGHYYSSFIEGPSFARFTAVSFHQAIPDWIKSEANYIISGEDLKPETWSDYVSAIEAHDDTFCYRNRPICKS